MGLPGPGRLVRLAAGTALHVTATGIGLAAGTASLAGSLVAPPVRHARAVAESTAASTAYTATVLAKAGARAVDDATDGGLEVAFTVAGTALGGRSPLGTRQLLLVNLLTDMFLAPAVAVAAPRRPPAIEIDPGDPLSGHPLAEELRAGPHRGFAGSVRRLVLVRGAATAAGATGAWATGRFTGSPHRAGSMGLAALISTQLAQTAWAGRRSPLVLVTAAGSAAVLVAVVQTPIVSRFFGCRPLGPIAWATVLGWSAAGAAGAELVPRWWELRAAQAAANSRTTAPAASVGGETEAGETITGAGVERGASVPASDPT